MVKQEMQDHSIITYGSLSCLYLSCPFVFLFFKYSHYVDLYVSSIGVD